MSKSKKKNHFNFSNAIVKYNEDDPRRRLIYVYYLTNDTPKNKEVNDIIIDMWYTRNRLVKNYPTLNWWDDVVNGEFEWLGIYVNNEHQEELKAEKQRRDKIRSAPVLQGNNNNGN